MKEWKDIAEHEAGCPCEGSAAFGTAEEMANSARDIVPAATGRSDGKLDFAARGLYGLTLRRDHVPPISASPLS